MISRKMETNFVRFQFGIFKLKSVQTGQPNQTYPWCFSCLTPRCHLEIQFDNWIRWY